MTHSIRQRLRRPFFAATIMAAALTASVGFAQRVGPPASPAPAPLTSYRGRQIADTMHSSGASWLIRENREQEERCSLLLTNLGVQAGMTVCDMGCGNGFYALKLARMVGPRGRVLAVDVQPEMLTLLKRRAAEEKLTNIEPILGRPYDPRLPQGQVDVLLLVDVYHEFSHPAHMLAAMRAALSPKGVIALVEYRAEDPQVPIKPLHKMSKRQIMNEFPPAGFRLVREFTGLPWQHLLFFAADTSDAR
jgi:cyclopropane fatty-acyl-phospholipid synthase-like methyltransferase